MGQNIGKATELPLSQVVADVQFIALETNADCFMDQDISKIELFGSRITVKVFKLFLSTSNINNLSFLIWYLSE